MMQILSTLLLSCLGMVTYGQGYSYLIPSPRLLYNSIMIRDTVPITLQLRTAQAACVHVYSNFEDIDTTFQLLPNSVSDIPLAGNTSGFSFQTALQATDRLIYVEATRPVAVSLFLNTSHPLDTLSAVNTQFGVNCRERYRAFGTDILPYEHWGSEYKMNLPLIRNTLSGVLWSNVNFFAYEAQDIVLKMDSLNIILPDSIPWAGCFISSGSGGNITRSDTILHLNSLTQRSFQIMAANTFAPRESGFEMSSLQNKNFAILPLYFAPVVDGNAGAGAFAGLEQLTPKDWADSSFYIPLLEQTDSMLASVVFGEDSTILDIDGQTFGPFQQEDVHRFFFTEPVVLHADKPVQIMAGTHPVKTALQDITFPSNPSDIYNLGTAMRVDAPSRFIRKTVFRPVVPADSSAKAYLSLICATKDMSGMTVNGITVSPALFFPFPSDGNYQHANIPLQPKTTYIVENPGGFMAIHYSRPADSNGFVGLYSITLSETPVAGAPDQGSRWRAEGDSIWHTDDTATVCIGQDLYLIPPESRHTSWIWNFPDGTDQIQKVGRHEPSAIAFPADLAEGLYSIYVSDSLNCLQGDTLYLEAVSMEVNIKTRISASCEGLVLELNAEGDAGLDINWTVNGQLIGKSYEMLYTLQENTTSVIVELRADNGFCDTVISREIPFEDMEEIRIPNVFTPNGDGINDCFGIDASELYENCYKMQVYSRWGQLVYQTSDPHSCWDGGTLAGGVYFYLIELGKSEWKGHVTLFR